MSDTSDDPEESLQKGSDPEMASIFNANFHLSDLESAFVNDKLFIFRLDLTKNLTYSDVIDFIHHHNIDFFLLCKENATQTEKPHIHCIVILPSTVSYKSFSDYLMKELIRPFGLTGGEYAKKKMVKTFNNK